MIRSILLVGAILLSTLTFATGFSKDSPQLKALASAWKPQNATPSQRQSLQHHDNIIMAYAGQDVTNRVAVPVLEVA